MINAEQDDIHTRRLIPRDWNEQVGNPGSTIWRVYRRVADRAQRKHIWMRHPLIFHTIEGVSVVEVVAAGASWPEAFALVGSLFALALIIRWM